MTRRQTKSTSGQPPAMMVVDDDAVVASATEPVEQVFGYAPAELVDTPVETVVADSTVPVAEENPATGATRARCQHASGAEFTARISWAPLASAPHVAVTVEDAFVAREERYDAALQAAARSLLRATAWDEAAEALVRTAGSVSSVDDAAVYVATETAEMLRPVVTLAGDPPALEPPAAASARRALETDSVARRDGDNETALSVPLDDRTLLRLVVQQGPAIDQAASFARKLASYGTAARSRLAGPETGPDERDTLARDPTEPIADGSEAPHENRPPHSDDVPRTDESSLNHDDDVQTNDAVPNDDVHGDETPPSDRALARRNAELRERVERLERRNEDLQEFTDVVAHDLRNPLNAAQACVELAEHEEGDVSGHLADLEDAHERMRDLIDDLLTLTRNGEAVGETQPVSLSAVAADAWTTVRTDHPDHDPTLEVAEAVPRIEADEERLRTLLENLFGNAIDHAGPDVTVRVGALPDGFYVADDGPGIPPDERERVFEHGYSTHSNGTGYGLAIVEGIASGHGWDATVTEAADGGARFEFHGVDRLCSSEASDSAEGTDD